MAESIMVSYMGFDRQCGNKVFDADKLEDVQDFIDSHARPRTRDWLSFSVFKYERLSSVMNDVGPARDLAELGLSDPRF